MYRSGRFGFWRRLVRLAVAPVAMAKLVIASSIRPFSAQVFSFPARLKQPLMQPEARFSLYNPLEETPVDRRRTFHRYLLAIAHATVAIAAVLTGYAYHRPGTESLGPLSVGALLIPYLSSAIYSIRVVSYQRVRVFLFVLLLIGGATLTGAFIAGAVSSVDTWTPLLHLLT